MQTDTAPLAELAARQLVVATHVLDKARAEFAKAAATNVAYAVKWHLDAAVAGETHVALWTVAHQRGAGALTVKLAEFMAPNDLRSSDPFARATAETQREAALKVLRLAAPYVDAAELLDRLV